jgi:hypothetical protein
VQCRDNDRRHCCLGEREVGDDPYGLAGSGWVVPGVAGPERNRVGTVIKSKKK